MTAARILVLIESADALAAILQTLRLHPTVDHLQRVGAQLHGMLRECDRLAADLTRGVEP